MSNKILVLDTSAIMSIVQNITTFRDSESPGFAGILGDNEIVIPRVVLDELDGLKRDKADRSKIALEAARQLEVYSKQGNLLEGVETEKGGILRLAPRPRLEKVIAWGLKANVADHEILATTIEIEEELHACNQRDMSSDADSLCDNCDDSDEAKQKKTVTLITQDRLLRVLARSIYSVKAEELKSVWVRDVVSEPGYNLCEVAKDELDTILEVGEYTLPVNHRSNEFYHIVDRENPEEHCCYAWGQGSSGKQAKLIDRAKVDYLKVAGEVQGKNVRQKLLLWALMGCGEPDPFAPNGVRLITISGPAGSGKSFLTLAAAWERLERGHFERIVITRPMVDVGTSLGYLPGTLEEKLRPWGGPIEDNLRAIVQSPSSEEARLRKGAQRQQGRTFDAKAWLEMEDRLEMVPLTYIRGRTFRRSFVILEEAQNIERGPLKVLLTRLGEGSVVVIVGDMSQIDNQFLSSRNNGLIHAINAFRNWPQAVHFSLKTIVRSDLAEAASHLL